MTGRRVDVFRINATDIPVDVIGYGGPTVVGRFDLGQLPAVGDVVTLDHVAFGGWCTSATFHRRGNLAEVQLETTDGNRAVKGGIDFGAGAVVVSRKSDIPMQMIIGWKAVNTEDG